MAALTIADIKKTAEFKMGKTVEALKHEMQKVRTGRAHPGILDQVHVEYYGSMVPISQVANVTLLDARTISVQPWEKGMGPKIEKAIRESDLGLNPSSQGDLLRVPMPPLTEERRKELTKVDGVYTADPKKDPEATRYAKITFDEAIIKNLQVLDATAFALCRDQKLPIKVFSIFKPGALKRVVQGEDEGTLVHV